MERLNTLLKKLGEFKVIKAKEDRMTLETPLGNLEVRYKVDVIYNHSSAGGWCKELPLQVVIVISKDGNAVKHWGSMSNEQNARIIHFFQEKYNDEVRNEHHQKGYDQEKVSQLLDLDIVG